MTDQGTEPSPPSGTVYGRGGVTAREPRAGGRLHPAVTALAVLAGLVVVLALGYWALRTPADVPESTTAAVPERTTSAAPPSRAVAPSPAPDRLGTGSWLLSLAGEPDLHLSAQDGLAVLAAGDPATLTVLPGLADESCFSFRDEDGGYLRHFDYRLRFDASDDSKLFRADATFCPQDERTDATVRLRSSNYPEHLLHRRGTELYIDEPDGSDEFVADSSFVVRKPPRS